MAEWKIPCSLKCKTTLMKWSNRKSFLMRTVFRMELGWLGGLAICMEEQHPLLVRGLWGFWSLLSVDSHTQLWKILGWNIHRLRINSIFLVLIIHDITATYLTSYHGESAISLPFFLSLIQQDFVIVKN